MRPRALYPSLIFTFSLCRTAYLRYFASNASLTNPYFGRILLFSLFLKDYEFKSHIFNKQNHAERGYYFAE
jgi:hypothetical protein